MTADAELLTHARSRVGALLCKKYKIEGVLGIGGMATVYSAVHRNGRRVAVKLLHPELSIRAEIRKRFLREGHAASAVNHPGVVVVLDDDVAEDGAAFLVLELLEGQQLEELWEQNGRKLPVKTVMAVARELCDVLAAAHRAGVVHRDIKPANLFVTRDGHLKVLDFGIARVRDAAASTATQTGAVFGTPAFMAPEQASGRVSLVDAQTDIWAVGATMFTLLSALTVHEGETGQHLAMLSATRPARSLGTVMPEAAPELVALVDRALAFEKNDRFATADAMRTAIIDTCRTLFRDGVPPIVSLSETLKVGTDPMTRAPVRSGPRLEQAAPLGSTTSAPVSGTAPTHRRNGPLLTRAARLVALAFAPTVAVEEQASSAARGAPPPVARAAILGVLMAAALSAVVAAGVLRHESAPAASGTAVATTDQSAPGPVASPAGIPPTGNATAMTPPPAALSALPSRPTASVTSPRPAIRPVGRPSTTTAPAVSAPASASTAKPKCDPPYFIDATGKTLWKAECL